MSMIARVQLAYGLNDLVKKMDRETYDRFRAEMNEITGNEFGEWKEDKPEPPHAYISGSILIEAPRDMMTLQRWGVSFEVKNFRGGYWAERPKSDPVAWSGQHNHVHVAISNNPLFNVNEVTYEEDCCTDHLQDMLNRKWRILAVCPPNDARRPTYILGRHNTEK